MADNGIEVISEERKSVIKAKKADRATDNMFRIVLRNHMQLTLLADNKAGMMITVCALIMTLSLANLGDPILRPAILSLGLTCIGTILFAVYATLPSLPPRQRGAVDPRSPGFNLIFFGHFTQLDLDTYLREMEQVVNNRAVVYESLIKDLYDLGKVLSDRKYRYIRISYVMFMAGLIFSAAILIFSLSAA